MADLLQKLVSENSDYRQLKFGSDRFGQGSSKEPFVNRVTLPGVEQDNPNVGLLGGNTDFLLRAGTLSRSAEDVSRITQLLLTTGKGNLFTVKQNLLSRTNVSTQAKTIGLNAGPYLPTSTIAQVGTSGLGFHLNKQGLNPFAATGVNAGEDGSGGNILEGFAAATSIPTYLSANIKGGDAGDSNRLVQLRKYKLVGPQDLGSAPVFSRGSRLISNIAGGVDNFLGTNLKNKVSDLIPQVTPELAANSISSAKDEILAYGGGPGAEIGVGRTIIKRYQDSTLYDNEEFRKKYYLLDNGQIESLSDYTRDNPGVIVDFRRAIGSDGFIFTNLSEAQKQGEKKDIITNSPNYSGPDAKNIEKRVNLGNPGRLDKNLESYTRGASDRDGNPFGALDKVTAFPLYQSTGVTADPTKNDLVKFRIAAINPHAGFKKTYIHFRAFLDSFSDSYSSEWNSFKYMGRSENFYKYQGFNRDVSLSWKIAAQSRQELIPMYKKLNYLQSIMTGDYSESGFMEGNLVDLTVGGYFWEQTGFFTSLQITFPEKSPYEIGIPDNVEQAQFNTNQTIETSKEVRELPLYLEVSANFIPIQNFVPRKQQNLFSDKGELLNYGKERYINLASEGGESSYDIQSIEEVKPSKVKPFSTQGPQGDNQVDLGTALGIVNG